MIFTGVDGNKTYSIDYEPFRKRWRATEKSGRKIYVIPSDKVLIKRDSSPIRDRFTLRRSLSLEIEEKFGSVNWDVSVDKSGNYTLVIYRDFEKPGDAYSLDAEQFSLSRTAIAHGHESVLIIDFGRRKTSFIELEGEQLKAYRVVLKGGDYINRRLAEARGIPETEAERLKIEKGIELKEAEESLRDILNSSGIKLKDRTVFLSGGGSRLKGIESFFGKVHRCEMCEPELASAFGASLTYAIPMNTPTFREEEVSPATFRRFGMGVLVSLLLFVGAELYIGKLKEDLRSSFRKVQAEEFKRVFPDKPAVAVFDQVRSMYKSGDNDYALTEKLGRLAELLEGKEVKIYGIDYDGDKLRVKGEGKKEVVDSLPVKELKKTPEGSLEFSLEI